MSLHHGITSVSMSWTTLRHSHMGAVHIALTTILPHRFQRRRAAVTTTVPPTSTTWVNTRIPSTPHTPTTPSSRKCSDRNLLLRPYQYKKTRASAPAALHPQTCEMNTRLRRLLLPDTRLLLFLLHLHLGLKICAGSACVVIWKSLRILMIYSG
jgi:hypothetical protein